MPGRDAHRVIDASVASRTSQAHAARGGGQATGRLRVVVFTCGDLGAAAAEQIAPLHGVERVTVIRTPYRTVSRNGLRKVRHVLRYGGLRHLLRRNAASRRADGAEAASPRSSTVDVLTFDDFHEPACIRALQSLAPDLGVIAGTYILQPAVFALPRLGCINLHTGKAPEYRGSAPGFWEMYNGERRVGITVHWVVAGVDAGAIIRQELFAFDPAPPGDPLEYIESYRLRVLVPNGLRMLAAAVEDIASGAARAVPQDASAAHTYRIPTSRQKAELRSRVARRRRPGLRRHLKRLLGWAVFRSGLYRRFLRGKAFIVLFHRVDDRYTGNPISCTTREFERYCAFFARYFDVVSAADLIDRIERADDLSGRLVITFDDGYADNVAAAEVMRRHELPGCFFIATDFIGTERDGWWDVEQGHRSHWMSWDDVRGLDARGFEIGAHTRQHVDLGTVSGAAARDEIVGSKQTAEAKLGHEVDLFCYPFGGKTNMTDENLEIIRAAGFRCCMSAYGGYVSHDSDLFDLQRVAVSPWHRSPWQLGLELLIEPMQSRLLKPLRMRAPATETARLTP